MVPGKFIHCSKPYPGGASEITIVQREIGDLLLEGEKIMGDWLFRFSSLFITSNADDSLYSRNVESQ